MINPFMWERRRALMAKNNTTPFNPVNWFSPTTISGTTGTLIADGNILSFSNFTKSSGTAISFNNIINVTNNTVIKITNITGDTPTGSVDIETSYGVTIQRLIQSNTSWDVKDYPITTSGRAGRLYFAPFSVPITCQVTFEIWQGSQRIM